MSEALRKEARQLNLNASAQETLRIAFGVACVTRVEQQLLDQRAIDALMVAKSTIATSPDAGLTLASLQRHANEVEAIARSHPGSDSIDGTGHAAVSTTFALAHALAGRALDAAGYAAYAAVYSYGGYAVNDPAAFEPEHRWQLTTLRALAAKYGVRATLREC